MCAAVLALTPPHLLYPGGHVVVELLVHLTQPLLWTPHNQPLNTENQPPNSGACTLAELHTKLQAPSNSYVRICTYIRMYVHAEAVAQVDQLCIYKILYREETTRYTYILFPQISLWR